MNIFIQYRNSRAIALLILLIPIFIYSLFLRDEVILRESSTGTILEIKVNRAVKPYIYWGRAELSDGTHVHVRLSEPIPVKGEIIPLLVFTFESGEKEYNLDYAKWPR